MLRYCILRATARRSCILRATALRCRNLRATALLSSSGRGRTGLARARGRRRARGKLEAAIAEAVEDVSEAATFEESGRLQNLPTKVFGGPSDFGVDMGDDGGPDRAEVDLIDPQLLAGVLAVFVAAGV